MFRIKPPTQVAGVELTLPPRYRDWLQSTQHAETRLEEQRKVARAFLRSKGIDGPKPIRG